MVERPKLIDIIAKVSKETGVSADRIISASRRALFSRARFLFAQRARDAGYMLVDIGEALGGRTHSAISNLLKRGELLYNVERAPGDPQDVPEERHAEADPLLSLLEV